MSFSNLISPRSQNYQRLEGGHGPSRAGAKRFAWKKFAIAAAVLIGLSDPDHSKTVHCTVPYKSSLPLVQYALMIDAGSTGSRIHIYKFNNCGPSASYEYEVFKMTQPGLSSFAKSPSDAARSLDVLLDEAVKTVPEGLRKCTPVAVKATAGLRLLGATESQAILDAVKTRLTEAYPFPLFGEEPVVIMDGKDEGVYAWITANYLLNTIRADSPKDGLLYAVLDLGGASTQIVFEPQFDSSKSDSQLEEGDHKYELQFGDKTHVLYQHSYLGYGLMQARLSVHKLVNFMATYRGTSKSDNVIGNPCLAKGTKREVTLDLGADNKAKAMMVGEDIGSFESCNRVMELVMAKDAICETKPCSFNGVYQPSILDTFSNGKVLLLSYFYDRLSPLLGPSTTTLNISTIATLASQVCEGKHSWEEHWGPEPGVMEELYDRPEYCLDLTFMHALLRLGYEFVADQEVMIEKKIDGTELGWCLGASIAMVGGELTCRV
ncbi:nucleoside phosphatase GDA1/CD39 [Neolentinus lepideus HHB14362 ss-1]|uniref:guanosine-diphosphatase n=1 Tax=Neolentinus lepideus HHB14362 ss-1 TaxID=1314782 RepID=A0A165R7E9_9AGAM|nr:nucleoside phosphatase GDA1/CD39 [Neolentinus lepideus HHB14362 ss-1]